MTIRVQKPENKIFKFFDPDRLLQRARACINIRFGSKNRKTKSSSFLTRACGNLQQPGQQHTHTHTHIHTHWARARCGSMRRGMAWQGMPRRLRAAAAAGRRDAGTPGTCTHMRKHKNQGPPRRRNTWHMRMRTSSNSAPPKAHSTKERCL